MKPTIYLRIIIGFIGLALISCEDKIGIDLPAGEQQLAVEGKIIYNYTSDTDTTAEDATPIVPDTIRVTMTNGYDDGPVPVVSNATVVVIDSTNGRVDTLDYVGNGKYITSSVTGEMGHTYALVVKHDGETYFAVDKINRVPKIDSLGSYYESEGKYGRAPGYFIKFIAKDLKGTGDFYRFKIYKNGVLFNRTQDFNLAYDAGFADNTGVDNQEFVFPVKFFGMNPNTGVTDTKNGGDKSSFVPGDKARAEILSISAQTMGFYQLLNQQLNNTGLFATPSVNVPSNIINLNPSSKKKAVGWFSTSALSWKEITVKDEGK